MWLFTLALICSFAINFSHGINVCRNTCNDGGCDYTDKEGTYKGCDCRFSVGLRTGNECESFTKPCEVHNPCKNGGKCVSTLGFPFCDCPTNYHGYICGNRHTSSDVLLPKKPSIYYRIKIRPGEKIRTYLVLDIDDIKPFIYQIQNNAIGTTIAMSTFYTMAMTADQFYSYCMNLGTQDFPMNEDMCNFSKTTYGDSNILVFYSSPYFIPKTRLERTDVYFNGDRREGRMGGKYQITVELFHSDLPKEILRYNLYHFAVDDELTYCLPFVDPGENCKSFDDLLKVKRSEDVPVIKISITPDTEVCNKSMTYTYQWKLFDGMISSYFNFIPYDPTKIRGLEQTNLNNHDIAIRRYVLPKGTFLLLFELAIGDNNYKHSNKNQYMCYLKVDIDGLHAEIVGSLVRKVSDSDLVTLDASLSHNPNEPGNKQDEIFYIWHCDVQTDKENCQKYITTNPVRKLIAPLNKSKKYVFKLVTMVNDEYVRRVGNPKRGTAKVTLLPNSSVFNVVIKCIKNCEHLSSPLEVIYLIIETNCNNCSFEWYYKEKSNSVVTSAENIRELNTPPHVFIAKRYSLDYDKTFAFKAKDSSLELESSIIIRTAAKPIAGKCHVNPTTGIAGMTLFTITCSQFRDVYGDNALFYYYYERYENDENGLGLLIDRGSKHLDNIKLSISGKLKVLAFNSYGTYVTVDTTVKISKIRTSKLSRSLRSMKNKLFSGQMSAMVQMLSIACDQIFESKRTKGFSVIFDTLSKVPPKGSLFLIEQMVLALKKAVLTYSVVNDNKMKPPDALEISTNLLISASNIFEYLKTHQNKDITENVEKIQWIFDSMKTIIDIIFKDFDPIIYTKNSGDSMRHFWSSLENTALVVQNIEETLLIFGESIVLHKVIYEKHKIYESKESSLWTDMISADMLKEQNNIIGHDLADELISKKNASWGFKVFEIDEKSGLWTEPKSHSNDVKSVIKYVALSAHDLRNKEYLGLVHEFVLPASIPFNITEPVDRNDEQYTISVPAAGSERIQFDKAVLVFRMDMTEIGAIFVTIKSRSRVLHVAWTRDCRPDSEFMADEQNVIKIPVGVDDYNITFKTQSRHQNDIHYIGIFTDTEANNSSSDLAYEVKFNMEMVCMRCVYWNNGVWSSRGLEIGSNSSVGKHIHCLTNHFSLFSSSIFAPPKLLNPIDEIQLFSTIANNMVCLILLAIVFTIYFIILYWSRVQDEKDILMGRIIVLDDNYTGEDEAYLITVYTGHGIGSGTTANVCVELNGTIRNSRAHWLHSPYYRTLLRSNDDWFLMFTPQSLGDLQSIHIWHDNFGTDPDWYCRRIIVSEIRTNKIWAFEVDRWFSLRRPAENIEHTVQSMSLNRDWSIDTQEHIGMGIREKHLWASVFLRHPRSPITRCQRLSVILSAVLSIMLASMIFYDVKHTDEEMFGRFELKLREFVVAIQSVLVEMVLTYGVQSCFVRGRQVQLNKIEQVQTQYGETEIITANQSKTKKVLEFIVERVAKKNVFYPIDTETIMERRQWNYWFIFGWICCATVYIITVFYIILYGLKFGRVKSLCWLMSIAIGIIQGAIVSTPFKIVLISVILAKYSQSKKNQLATYTYHLTLHRYRTKTLLLLQDVDYVRKIRKYRRSRYFYTPPTDGVVDIFRKRRKLMADRKHLIAEVVICVILILTSLCCLYHLNVLGNQNNMHLTNRMTYKYLEDYVFGSNNRRISLDGLRNLLSRKFLKALHSVELYNGMPISNESIDTIKYGKTGWFGLYNARLIGGGVRLGQQRIDSTGKMDTRHYGPGWTEPIANNGTTITTPWTYSKSFLFKSRLMLDNAEGYYQLNLTGGGLVENKIKLDENLKLNWLDAKTRRVFIEFQMYTPGADSITAVEMRMDTDCGLSYSISTDVVQTLPAGSVIADWDAYVFAAVATVALAAFAAARLLSCARRGPVPWTSSASAVAAAYDGLLAALAVATALVLFQRQAAMRRATAELTAGGHVDLTGARRAQTACASCAASIAAAALLRLSRPLWPDGDESPWTAVAIVVAATAVAVSVYADAAGALFAAGIGAAVLLLFVGSRRASHGKRKFQ